MRRYVGRLSRLQLQAYIGVVLVIAGLALVAAAASPFWLAAHFVPRTPFRPPPSPGDEMFIRFFAAPFVVSFVGGPLTVLTGIGLLIVTGMQAIKRRGLAKPVGANGGPSNGPT